MEHISESIPGWFDWHDTYRRWAREVPEGGVIVEVGVFCGKSFAFLTGQLLGRGDVHLHAVDTWQGSPELMQFSNVRDGSYYNVWRQWLDTYESQLCNGPSITEHRMPSVEAAAGFADGSVDRVWLDGDHSTAGLLADLQAWWPKVKPGGEIGGHDFGFFGVTPAVERFAHRNGLPIEVLQPCPEAGTTNVGPSFLLRKPAPVTSWAVPEGQRSVLVCGVSNHPFIPRQSVEALAVLMLHARESAAKVGFQAEFHWEADAFTLDTLRDRAVYRAICEGFSHLLFLDADNVWPHDLLERILPLHELGVVGGLYHLKKAPHEPIALRKATDDPDPNMYRKLPHVHEEDGPVEVDALGMGCTLIPTALCRQMGRPWFKFQADQYGWNKVTEDIWFCQQAKAAGARLWVDPRINVGHVAHTVVGVRQYEPHVAVIEKAHREKARRLRRAQGAA